MADGPHRRLNALTGEWILVSPHRTERPWQGSIESSPAVARLEYDPGCYLCPGNARAGGNRNPDYRSTYAFTNDFAALLPEGPAANAREPAANSLLRMKPHAGECRVLCFSPRHDLTLARMSAAQIRPVVDLWAEQVAELSRRWHWVQVFENKGEAMGCSNPHPHGQIWATDFLPNEPARELARQESWFQQHGTPMLMDYISCELSDGGRVVLGTQHWLAVVPWWAIWPFETLLMPRRHVASIPDLSEAERDDLAAFLQRLLRGYDELFQTSFPYSMGWHGAPSRGSHPGWQLHGHIYPPLLRSARIRKFMVGFEMLAEPQRDLTPESAAQRLRQVVAAG